MNHRRVAALKTAADLRHHLSDLGVSLPFDEAVQADGPLSWPYRHGAQVIGNRFAVLPMEGWDGTADGRPTELTRRRWRHFGQSGAKLIWGGEAVAVRPDGRANPNQLLLSDATVADLAALREILVNAHGDRFGRTDDLLVGLQLTHSGALPDRTTGPAPSRASLIGIPTWTSASASRMTQRCCPMTIWPG